MNLAKIKYVILNRFLDMNSINVNELVSKILIPTNKNPLVNKAVDYITQLFPNAEYYIIGVVDLSAESTLLYSSYSAEYLDVLEKLEEEAVNELEDLLKKKSANIKEKLIKRGSPVKVILEYSKLKNINLILLLTSTKIGAEQVTLGRTAKKIIIKSKIPTLLITPQSNNRIPIKTIINPSSGSKYSFRASILSINFAKMFNASVKTILFSKNVNEKVINSLKDYAKSINVNYEIENVHLEREELVERLLKETELNDIMIASRGRKSISYKFRYFSPELALGSLEREVISMSKCPIILINE